MRNCFIKAFVVKKSEQLWLETGQVTRLSPVLSALVKVVILVCGFLRFFRTEPAPKTMSLDELSAN